MAYAGALADLEALRGEDPRFALAATDGPLLRRVRRLLGVSSTTEENVSLTWIVTGAVVTVLAFALMGEHVRSAQDPTAVAAETRADVTNGTSDMLGRLDELVERLRAAQRAVEAPAPETTTTAKGGVSGHILDDGSSQPLANATVELSEGGRLAAALTDRDGRYEVHGLEPGEYQLFVRAEGYVPAEYGQRQPTETGVRVTVRRDQLTSGMDVRLQQAGAISGRIFGDSGGACQASKSSYSQPALFRRVSNRSQLSSRRRKRMAHFGSRICDQASTTCAPTYHQPFDRHEATRHMRMSPHIIPGSRESRRRSRFVLVPVRNSSTSISRSRSARHT